MSVLIGGFAASQMLYVAARLKLADLLAAGPLTAGDLARESGAKQAPLWRIVQALAAFGVFEIREGGLIANTPLSDCLRTGAEDSLRDVALVYGEEHYHAMSELLQAVRHGGTAFEHAYRKPHFSYLASNADAAAAYYKMEGADRARSAQALARAYDFKPDATVIDVAGGTGQLLRAVLHAHPSLKGTIVESSGMAQRARARVRAEGLDERCDVQTGDVFEAVPRGGDVYLLGHVLHGLDDDRAACVLRNCRRAMGRDARLIVVERTLPSEPATGPEAQHAFLADALAMAISGGVERTGDDLAALLTASGLETAQVLTLSTGDDMIEARVQH
jgi:ubiquinone/menaquinone biosynthesis C-methylase UbiE